MNVLTVQEILREATQNGKSPLEALELLKYTYAISYKAHSKWPDVYLLKYNQIESLFSERAVRECRGLILDSSDNWQVVSCPFFKFFNYGESLASSIDWTTARVQEKVDGSLIVISNYKDEWNVSTSGCPDGTNFVNDSNITFRELFESVLRKCDLDLDKFAYGYTYMFELTSPLNRVVVDHKESKVTLIGIRNNQSLREVPINDKHFVPLLLGTLVESIPVVKSYPLTSLEECISASNKLNPLEQEGYVVVDGNFNRVKVKSPNYIAIHHIKDSFSLRRIADVVKTGEQNELLLALESYPDRKQQCLEVIDKYNEVVSNTDLAYKIVKNIVNQKEFAVAVKDLPFRSVLFAMRKTGLSSKKIISEMLSSSYYRLLGLKD